MSARAVVIELEDAPAVAGDPDRSERQTLAHRRKVEDGAIGRQEWEAAVRSDRADPADQRLAVLGQPPDRIMKVSRHGADDLFLLLLLDGASDRGVVEGVLAIALEHEVVVRQHPDVVEDLSQLVGVSAPRGRGREDELVGHDPAGREQAGDRIAHLRRHLHRRLDVGLDHELLDPDLGRTSPEAGEDLRQRRRDPLGQIGQQPGTQPDPHDLGVLLPVRARPVRLALGTRHLVDGVEDALEGAVRAHERVAPGDQNIPKL